MKKIILYSIGIALLTISVSLHANKFRKYKSSAVNSEIKLPKYFYKRFEGTIGNKYPIVMNLVRRDSMVDGNYYYANKGIPIFFTYESRIDDDGNVYLGEETGKYDTNYASIVSGVFKGKFISGHEIKGIWEKPNSKSLLEFSLVEKYPDGSAELEMKRYSKSYVNGDERADIDFMYPVLISLQNKDAERMINTRIEKTYLKDYNFGDRNIDWKSYNEMMEDFISRYKSFVRDTSLPKDYKPMWGNSFYANVIFNSDGILSLENIEFRFEGGAHPMTFFIYANYNLQTGNEITLADILKENYKPELDKIGEKVFREAFHIKPGETYEQAGFFINKNGFHLNNNFVITKAGLRFRFGQYEIGPYVMGAPSVFIPYSQLKDLIKPDGLLSQFLK